MARKYNYIFHTLVEDKSDIYGHFAYNAYKLEKIKFIEDFKTKNGGKAPTDKDLENFHQKSLTRIHEYKTRGKEVADRMIKTLVNDQIINMQADCMESIGNSLEKALENQPKPSKNKSFWMGVASSCVGSFFVALVPFVLALICYIFNPSATRRFIHEFIPSLSDKRTEMEQGQDSVSNDEKTVIFIDQ